MLKCRKTRPTFSTADLVTRCIFHQAGLTTAANQIKSSDAQGEFELDLSSAIRTFKGGGGGDAILRGFSQSGGGGCFQSILIPVFTEELGYTLLVDGSSLRSRSSARSAARRLRGAVR